MPVHAGGIGFCIENCASIIYGIISLRTAGMIRIF